MGVKERNREFVLNLSKQILLKRGILGVSMSDIAEEVGFGVASLYRYFGNRESLIMECAVELWHDRYAKIRQLYEQNINKTGYEQLLALSQFFPWLIVGDKEFSRILSSLDVYFQSDSINKEDKKKYDHVLYEIYDLFKKSYDKGVEDGTIKPLDDFELFCFTTMQALISMSQKVVLNGVLSKDRTYDDKMNMLITIFADYVKNQK